MVKDFSDLAESERDKQLQSFISREVQLPFNLRKCPLIRMRLLFMDGPEGNQEYVLPFILHHIIFDGWSVGILFREMTALYQAFVNGRLPSLPAPPIQYADFAYSQRRWLQGEVLEKQLAFWKHHLEDAPAVLELPTDRPHQVGQSYRGRTYSFTIPAYLTEQLNTLGRRQGVMLFTILFAAFNVLLHRYSGQSDICVGIPVANSNRAEIEGLIGFFVNTLVLHSNFSGNPNVSSG